MCTKCSERIKRGDRYVAICRHIEYQNKAAGTPALSLWRPWPWLILHAGKDVENRCWGTGYRGLIVLHAGKTIDKTALADLIGLDLTNSPNEPDALELGFVGVAAATAARPSSPPTTHAQTSH